MNEAAQKIQNPFMQPFNRPLILASKSPRRSQLLREAGFDFEVKTFDTDESWPPELPADDVPQFLATKKARAAAHLLTENEVILAADTVVLIDGDVLNKPADHAEAFGMIRRLAGRGHRVITGVCLLSREKEVAFSSLTHVFFSDLTDGEINFYLQKCQPFDKAGSYGAQEWLGHCKISRIDGSYPNVMGLPVDLVYEALRVF